MPAMAGDSIPVGKVPILRPSSAARACVGVSRGAPGESTAKEGRPFAAVEEQDVGAFLDVHLDAGDGLVHAGGRAAIGARHDQDAGVLRGSDGGADLHARFLPRQAGFAAGRERARRDLVLDEDGGGAEAAVGANGALDVHRIAVAVVAVREDEQIWGSGAHHVEGVEHFRE